MQRIQTLQYRRSCNIQSSGAPCSLLKVRRGILVAFESESTYGR
jgi:hypothetical protein